MPRFLTVLLVLLATAPAAGAPYLLMLPPVDKAAAAAEDVGRAQRGEPYRFALPADVTLDAAITDGWEDLPAGACRWRLVVACPGCTSLNLGFSRFRLPWGARLEVGGHAYTAVDNAAHGELWTQIVPGDTLTATLTVDAGRRDEVDLVLARVGRGYRDLEGDKAGACNVDVVCPEGDDWRSEIRSVAVFTLGGIWKCTGAMVNNTAQDETPLFLTANHCAVTASSAPSMVVYWNFQSPTCGQHGGGSLADFQSGAIWRASYAASDFTLVELEEDPDPAFGVTFAGWDARGDVPAAAVTIHHPSSDEKSISFENDPLSFTTYLSNTPGDQTHLRIADWDLGTTEPGSSGSPLFDPEHRIVGQLHGGYAACGNDLPDWYGRLAVSWEGGGTAASRLRDWLDPGGLGLQVVDLRDPGQAVASGLTVAPATDLEATGRAGGPFQASPTYTLTNQGDDTLEFTVTADADWLAPDSIGGTLLPAAQTVVTLVLTPAAEHLTAGTYRAVVTFTDVTAAVSVLRQATLVVTPVELAFFGLAPNPALHRGLLRFDLPAAGAVTLEVYDLRGRRLRAIGAVGEPGVNVVPWDGRDDDGARVPAGAYVGRLLTPWGIRHRALTLLH